ncbi:MAG: hypothetical protein E6G34_10140 [Actinobacteria bacterium]|nr:MAG: hypothetical protein E6G34_10140 [Actinomycetota bacterium]
MRSRAVLVLLATASVGLLAATSSSAASSDQKVCTWGGTPAAPTGVITLDPGITNTPSTQPTQFVATGELGGGEGCSGTLTFTGTIEAGTTCAINAPFHAKARGLPPIKTVEAPQPGAAGSQLVLLYDAQGNVVGSEQAQFLTSAVNESDPAYLDCNSPQGLTFANWSDTVELFGS